MSLNWIVVASRISLGLTLLSVAGWFGFTHRNPWIIAFLGVAFTALYISGKWYAWRGLWAMGGYRSWGKELSSTLPTQSILAGLLYLVGLGLGRLFASQPFSESITLGDITVILVLVIIGIAGSLIIGRLESGKDPMDHMEKPLQSSADATAEAHHYRPVMTTPIL